MDRLCEIVISNAGSASVMALVVALLSRVIRRPAVLHILWLAVLFRLFAPPLLEIPLLPASAAGLTIPQVGVVPAAELPAPVETTAPSSPLLTPRDLAVWMWLLGGVAVAILSVFQSSRLRRLLDTGEPTPWALSTRVESLAVVMGVRRPPLTTLVNAPVPPMLWGPLGGLRLVLPLPLLARLSESERDTLIAHELAHVRRRDHLVRHLELAAMVVFWWLPVTWWARRRLRSAEELCCDGLVAHSLPDHGRAYADCLVKTMDYLASNRSPHAAVCSGLGGLSEMKGRIQMIMTQAALPSLTPLARVFLLFAVVTALAVFPSLTARSASATGAAGVSSIEASNDRINLNLQDAALRDVLGSFARIAELNVVVDPRAMEMGILDSPVTIRAVDTPWDEVLDEILESKGAGLTIEGTVLWIHPRGVAFEGDRLFTGDPIDLTLESANLTDVLASFSKIADLVIDADPDVQGKVTVAFNGVPWDQALDMILRISGCGWSWHGGTLSVYRTTQTVGEQLAVTDATGTMKLRPSATAVDPAVIGTLDGQPLYRYLEGSRMTAPLRIAGTDPEYPPDARSAGIEGKVVLETVIDAEGSVRDVFAIRSPSDAFTLAAVEAVRLWQFEPATLDGTSVPVHYFLTVKFSLE
jgi:TonB family protein